jgi:hypothetical protein
MTRKPETSLEERLDYFTSLKQGWFDGDQGSPIPTRLVHQVRRFEGRDVFAFPAIEGGITIEWDTTDWTIQLDFEPDGTLYAMALRFSNGSPLIRDLEITWHVEDWYEQVGTFVTELVDV